MTSDGPERATRLRVTAVTGGRTPEGAASPIVDFHRAPRVSVSWRVYDALMYNLMSMNPAMMLVIPLLAAFSFYSAGSLALAFLIVGLFCGAQAFVYAFLSSSMPHSGGDYYFQSRLLSRTVGSVVGLACIVFGGGLWMAIACWLAGNVVVGPALVIIGRLLESAPLQTLGVWVQTGTGMFALSVVVVGWALLVNVRNPRSYLRLQLICWIVGATSVVGPLIMLLLAPTRSVVNSAAFAAAAEHARFLGYQATEPGVSGGQVLALLAVAAFPLIYPAWSIHHLGEMQGANRLRSQLITMVGAELLTVAASAAVVWLFTSRIGWTDFQTGAYLFITDRSLLPMPTLPIFWFFSGELWPGGVAALCMVVFFNALFWMWVPDIPLAASRVLMAMGRSRSLPSWLGSVSQRDGTPVHAVVAFSVASLLPAAAYAYTELWRLSMAETLLNGLAFALTCGLAALMPYRNRETYRYSTAAPYEFLRVPVVTILGFTFVAFIALVSWRFAVDAGLSFARSPILAWLLVAGCYGASFALVTGYGFYRGLHERPKVEVTYRIRSSVD